VRKAFLLAPLLVALALVAAFLVACGSGGEDNGGSEPQAPVASGGNVSNITVRAGDWYFEPNNFRVTTGTVRVTFTSVGPMFPHTFSVKNLNGEGELFTSDRFENGTNGTFEFTVSQPGTYQVICVIRGHVDRGQTGTLTVAAQ